MNKYKLIKKDFTVNFLGKKLFRIQCIKEFANIKKNEKGGFVESEHNLDQSGNAWVSSDAQVSGDALVSGDAQVYGNARVYGNALVSGDAQVSGNAWVSSDAQVYNVNALLDY